MADILNFRDDAPVTELPVSVEEFLGASNATAVRIEPGEDARVLLPYLDRIALVEVTFPAFGDGRGYSSAQILREAGYQGELRASGDVLVDQIFAMRRCGFDSALLNAPLDPAVVEASLTRYADIYQKTIDGRQPIWAKRHEVQ
ncbi:MAG: DUF934 domain-containing protein [Sphingobium sp.]|nr:DUF934 domain-containing protein [Sphingobium sp.]